MHYLPSANLHYIIIHVKTKEKGVAVFPQPFFYKLITERRKPIKRSMSVAGVPFDVFLAF